MQLIDGRQRLVRVETLYSYAGWPRNTEVQTVCSTCRACLRFAHVLEFSMFLQTQIRCMLFRHSTQNCLSCMAAQKCNCNLRHRHVQPDYVCNSVIHFVHGVNSTGNQSTRRTCKRSWLSCRVYVQKTQSQYASGDNYLQVFRLFLRLYYYSYAHDTFIALPSMPFTLPGKIQDALDCLRSIDQGIYPQYSQ